MKMFLCGLGMAALAYLAIRAFYTLFWRGRGGDWIVAHLQTVFGMSPEEALRAYRQVFRNNTGLVWIGAILVAFFILFAFFLTWFTHYFNQINRGIDALLEETAEEIRLASEMSAVEKKLNTARQTLRRRAQEAQQAEQRKNDLVMYLAHDIRTPLTSVIGYLSLLDEAEHMPEQQRQRYVHLTLEKACRLEEMVNEFFEITRYHLQQIQLYREEVDLCYLLVQMTEEFDPIFARKGNTPVLRVCESLPVEGDRERLARVFGNLLKNAAAYSDPASEIVISAQEQGEWAVVAIQNTGPTIPPDQLDRIFERFCRLDDARASDTGGAGLGLAIAREIVTLHGGTIEAESGEHTTSFRVMLPRLRLSN